MVLPGLAFFLMFRVIPTLGTVIAWQDYSIFKGFLGSDWVGWKHFVALFRYPDFLRILRNTFSIGMLTVIIGVPAPLILALILTEIRLGWLRNTVQNLIFFPHFLSWVVVGQIVYATLAPDSGIVNIVRGFFGMEQIFYMTRGAFFQPIAVLAFVWKEAGYFAVIYFAAISSINPSLFEAADMDGAGKLTKITYITIPSVMPTFIIMLLLQISRFLEIGFDHIWNLLNPVVLEQGDILNTYIFRVGLQDGRYSFTTAVGIFKGIVGLVLVLGSNRIAERLTGKGFYKNAL
jgi:putative aldouronate transport system permease protein